MTLMEIQNNFISMVERETGWRPVAEFRFLETRKWRFDYAIPCLKVAIEVEGGSWIGGRHTNPKGFEADMEKYNTAESLGWHVLRILPDRLCTMLTMKLISTTINTLINETLDTRRR